MTLKERRESLSLTQVQLAEIVGTSPGRISNWESGCGMTNKNALAMASALHCRLEDIIGEISWREEQS